MKLSDHKSPEHKKAHHLHGVEKNYRSKLAKFIRKSSLKDIDLLDQTLVLKVDKNALNSIKRKLAMTAGEIKSQISAMEDNEKEKRATEISTGE